MCVDMIVEKDESLHLHYIIVINVVKEKKTSTTLQKSNAIKKIDKMSFQSTSEKTGSDVADLISWEACSRQRRLRRRRRSHQL